MARSRFPQGRFGLIRFCSSRFGYWILGDGALHGGIAEESSRGRPSLDIIHPIDHPPAEVRPAVAGIADADGLDVAGLLLLLLVFLEVLHIATRSMMVLRIVLALLAREGLVDLPELLLAQDAAC